MARFIRKLIDVLGELDIGDYLTGALLSCAINAYIMMIAGFSKLDAIFVTAFSLVGALFMCLLLELTVFRK